MSIFIGSLASAFVFLAVAFCYMTIIVDCSKAEEDDTFGFKIILWTLKVFLSTSAIVVVAIVMIANASNHDYIPWSLLGALAAIMGMEEYFHTHPAQRAVLTPKGARLTGSEPSCLAQTFIDAETAKQAVLEGKEVIVLNSKQIKLLEDAGLGVISADGGYLFAIAESYWATR